MGEKKSQAAGKTLQKNGNSAIISDNSAADGRGASRMKRENYITWDEYFMGVAMLAARRSKDPNTQVGACIVSPDNIIISTGYNGLPNGCSDDEYPWEREGEETKYPYVVHAELNAILNANGRDLRGSRLLVHFGQNNKLALPVPLHAVIVGRCKQMNAPKPSSRRASKRCYTCRISTQALPLHGPPNGCWAQGPAAGGGGSDCPAPAFPRLGGIGPDGPGFYFLESLPR